MALDAFAIIIFGTIIVLLVWVIFLGIFHPKSGAEVLGWSAEDRARQQAEAEAEDISQMLEAANSRRRLRGAEELTEESVHDEIRRIKREMAEEKKKSRTAEELSEMEEELALINMKRRKRGQADLRLEDLG